MARVNQGAIAPQALKVNVVPGLSTIDLTGVLSALFQVQLPDNTTTTWSAVLGAVTPAGAAGSGVYQTLPLTHTFVSNDTTQAGEYRIYAELTGAWGVVRTGTFSLDVVTKFAR